jgi:hypothetical protein
MLSEKTDAGSFTLKHSNTDYSTKGTRESIKQTIISEAFRNEHV